MKITIHLITAVLLLMGTAFSQTAAVSTNAPVVVAPKPPSTPNKEEALKRVKELDELIAAKEAEIVEQKELIIRKELSGKLKRKQIKQTANSFHTVPAKEDLALLDLISQKDALKLQKDQITRLIR